MRDIIVVLSGHPGLAALVARTLRFQQVYCKMLPWNTPGATLTAMAPKGIIWAAEQAPLPQAELPDLEAAEAGIPVLALGGAAAALCRRFGGSAEEGLPDSQAVTLGLAQDPLFTGIAAGERVLHQLECMTLPEALAPLATATEQCIGFRHKQLPIYAMEYPIEHNDPDAARLLQNFATLVCGARADWDEDAMIRRGVAALRDGAGEGRAICAVSGGVDSAVCAKLAHMAVGEKLTCVLVDTGLLRHNEAEEAERAYHDLGLNFLRLDARDTFRQALSGVTRPEEKKRLTAALLWETLRQWLAQTPDVTMLIGGANLNDTLCGGPLSKQEAQAEGNLSLAEPLRDLFKEEVRRLGAALNLPVGIVERHSFPVSGLALRVLGEVTPRRLELLRKADAIFGEELRAGGHEKRLWQFYATLLEDPEEPGRHVVVLRALQGGPTRAYAARLPHDALERVTERIRGELGPSTKVLLDLAPGAQAGEPA